MNLNLQQRKSAIVQLGSTLESLANDRSWPGFGCGLTRDEYNELALVVDRHYITNGWFTRENVIKAFKSWAGALKAEHVDTWIAPYNLPEETSHSKIIGVICAGNIPLVGLHDLLSVLISGHSAKIKLSTSDNLLIPAICKILTTLEPGFEQRISFTEKLNGYDAVIATGSNNSARYFEYYFSKVPHIIRKSRTSIAVLDGNETPAELQALGNDIFDYFGLGCRNISKIFIPKNYSLNTLFEAIYPFNPIINHNKYANNYDYNKAVWLLNQENLLDNGFILLKEDERLASPTASLFFEYYDNPESVDERLKKDKSEIQCIIGHGYLDFGSAQNPMLWDYADGVDTMQFLIGL